ncbi:MAG: CvpA family protein [Candidatus Borkfalkiaceae bacterium]|nr:CvpA family protein [Christensenellaceae bacterium]
MEDILFWVVLVLTALPIVVGALLGLKRGLNRSLLRLVIVGAAILAAWLMRDTLTEAIMNMQIGGQSFKQSLEAAFSENSEMLKLIMPIAQIAVGVFAFLVTFLLLKLVSLIVFWLLCIVVRPGKLKNRLLGLAVGAVQGILVAYFICVPITGLVGSIDKASQVDFSIVSSGSSSAKVLQKGVSLGGIYKDNCGFNVIKTSDKIVEGGDGSQENAGESSGENVNSAIPEDLKLLFDIVAAYKKTPLYKIYNEIEFGTYKGLTTVKSSEGKNVTLNVQIDAVIALSKIAKSAQKLQDIKISESDELTQEKIDDIKEVLNNIEQVKSELPAEVKESITEIVSVAAESFDMPVDVSKIDLDKVDFSKAGEALEKAYQLQKAQEDGTEEVNPRDMLEVFVESNLVIPAAEMGVDVGSMLSEADKKEMTEVIAELENEGKIDDETKAALQKILGLTSGAAK